MIRALLFCFLFSSCQSLSFLGSSECAYIKACTTSPYTIYEFHIDCNRAFKIFENHFELKNSSDLKEICIAINSKSHFVKLPDNSPFSAVGSAKMYNANNEIIYSFCWSATHLIYLDGEIYKYDDEFDKILKELSLVDENWPSPKK